MKFYIVDVFAREKYTGNQLAVFILDREIDSSRMQQIAAEINFSETTFVSPDPVSGNRFKTRIFTPAAEIPFAGHPTLGTAFIINRNIVRQPVTEIALDLPAGKIPVAINYQNKKVDTFWMKQNLLEFGRIIPKEEVCPVLNLSDEDKEPDYPVHEISTGLPYFIIPLKSLKAVQSAKVNAAAYDRFMKKYNPGLESGAGNSNVISSAFFIFTTETQERENDIHARMFDPYYGVPEDAATGSANGCLLAYLIKHRFFGVTRLNLRVEQGYEMDRPSLLHLKGEAHKNGEIDIFVGGQVRFIAEGFWQA